MIEWLRPALFIGGILIPIFSSIPLDYDCSIYGCPDGLICVSSDLGCYSVDEVEQILYESENQPENNYYDNTGSYDYDDDEVEREARALPYGDGSNNDNELDFSSIDEDQLLPDLSLDFDEDPLGVEKEIEEEDNEIKKLESDSAKTESSSVVVFLAQK